jgi:acyl-CoA reductase-like NAD-dependent aldehyde dehydrogenase
LVIYTPIIKSSMNKTYGILIGKELTKGSSTIPVVNPFTGESFAQVCLADPDTIDKAIILAEKAFKKTRILPSYERSRICSEVATGIQRRSDEFAKIIAQESGKPLIYARAEVTRSISTFEIASQEALRLDGEMLTLDITESAHGKAGLTRRFPIGPIAGISPFNFPLNLVAHKVAPALACGNPIILKPASSTPLTALLLGEIVQSTQAIEGSLSVLPCTSTNATPLVEDSRLKMVTFTGSPNVGWDIKKRAGRKKVVLELGGNAGVIVEPDAEINLAAKKIAFGAFVYSGQVCISVQRVYVHSSIYDNFLVSLINATKEFRSGDPLDQNVTMGPMIDQENAERIELWVDEAVAKGAKILIGGNRDNNYYPPTILTNVNPNLSLACSEAFGPILIVSSYTNFNAAIKAVNDTDFGLQAGVFTNNMNKALGAFNQLDVGGVVINDTPTFRVDNMPYGGLKDSGFGREGIKYSLREMTEIKLLVYNHLLENENIT